MIWLLPNHMFHHTETPPFWHEIQKCPQKQTEIIWIILWWCVPIYDCMCTRQVNTWLETKNNLGYKRTKVYLWKKTQISLKRSLIWQWMTFKHLFMKWIFTLIWYCNKTLKKYPNNFVNDTKPNNKHAFLVMYFT